MQIIKDHPSMSFIFKQLYKKSMFAFILPLFRRLALSDARYASLQAIDFDLLF